MLLKQKNLYQRNKLSHYFFSKLTEEKRFRNTYNELQQLFAMKK